MLSNFNPVNEPVFSYGPGSPERASLKQALSSAKASEKEIPMIIGGQKIYTDKKVRVFPPHEHAFTLGYFYEGGKEHVHAAIDAAQKAKESWTFTPWQERAQVFLRAADLISGKYRYKINAATMLGQSKNAYQAEIDSACEMADFLRFNVKYLMEIYAIQPSSCMGVKNELEYRPLEGFIFALTPFNFTAIAGNLPAAPALMGNTVIWKPAYQQVYAAEVLMEIFMEAGLPDGVINLIFVDGPAAGEIIFKHEDFGGIHFTGSTNVFRNIWKTIGEHIHLYKSFPKIVGETGGKDFVVAHASADVKKLSVALLRGAFEYQGQKCSAASRAYIPDVLWPKVKEFLLADMKTLKIGSPEDFSNFINAVIDEKAFDRIVGYLEKASHSKEAEIIAGGSYDKSEGYFIEPTVILTRNPHFITMEEEIFGPVLTIYVYTENEFEQMLTLVDTTSPYALTGAVFSQDEKAIALAKRKLIHAAGNFYINDKPTGAVVNEQPFGGARASGTNDKAGSVLNLLRWVSPRTIKTNDNPPIDYRYPFLD